MKKFIGSVLTTTLILGGCSMMENESSVNSGLKMLFYGGLKMSFFSGLRLSYI
ncbi:putative lipoprotein [Staphylococcus aureus]|nr:putative lipoprotein [Staphylococcus aureus]